MLRILYLFIILIVSSCSNINLTEPAPEPKRQSIFGGPLTFSADKGSFSSGNQLLSNSKNNYDLSSLPVNELLWKSTLDILDFMSFENIDPFGGVIESNWFTNKNNQNIRNKVIVSFSSSELKTTSVKVSVTREKYVNQKWVSDGYSDGLARKIEDLILSRARELRNNS